MTFPTLSPPALATARYERWHWHFLGKRSAPESLPWHESYLLSACERRAVGRSLQQFQLGEFARGRGFKRRASSDPVLGADPWFLPALALFIEEEQGHSNILGRFLDHEGIPRIAEHWLDGVFRRLRKLAGLEMCATVLVTAEVLAMPFYQALRDATGSNLLRSICVRILCDEAAHLKFQGLTLGLLRRKVSCRGREVRSWCHAVFFHCTALILWQQHRRVFRAAGWGFRRYWNDAQRWFRVLEGRILEASRDLGRRVETRRQP